MRFPKMLAGSLITTSLLSLVAPTLALAEGPRSRRIASSPKITTQTSSRDLRIEEDQSGTALALFVGAGASYYSVLAAPSSKEADKSGSGYQGRAGFTFFSRSLALELGVGWLQASVKSGTAVSVAGNTTTSTSSEILTRAGLVEFSPRIRLGSHFEIGPSAGALFGTNASFGTTRAQPDSPILAGLKLASTWQTRELHFRVVGQAMSSLSIPERRVTIASIGLEIGLPFLRGKTIVRETEVRQVEERHDVEYIETQVEVEKRVEVEVEKRIEVVLFSFDDQVIHFEFDRAKIIPGSQEFVSKLGRFLAANPQLWSNLKIEGHTDNRGSSEYNQKLSNERAQAVVAALVAAGTPSDKLSSQGIGFGSPVDRGPSDISRARNRRVELSFSDVSDAKALRDAINRIRFETLTPRTCAGGRCS